jgi:hypothetical protein
MDRPDWTNGVPTTIETQDNLPGADERGAIYRPVEPAESFLRDSPGIAPVKTTPPATPRPTVEPVAGLKRPIDARNPVTCPIILRGSFLLLTARSNR